MNKAIPLSVPVINGNEWKYVKGCLDSGWVSSAGIFIDKFEKAIAKYTGARYAVACINGTSGLQIALKIAGVGLGDEVIVPTLTFIAPVNAVKYIGAEPVFMDCDSHLNMDPEKLKDFCARECSLTGRGLKNKRTGRLVKAVVPVHIFGNPCSLEGIIGTAGRFGLKVVEDAAESIGSYYTGGRFRGSFTGAIGDYGVYSFNGNKIITTGGGGMIVTDDRKSADKIRYLTTQAKDDSVRYIHNDIGYNFRMSNLQAALGMAQLERLEEFIGIKRRNYGHYKNSLKALKGLRFVEAPCGTRPNHWFYSLVIEKEGYGGGVKGLMSYLKESGIETRPLWYLAHMQKMYRRNQAYRIDRAAWFWKRVLNLPCSCDLTSSGVERVAAFIKKWHERHGS